VVRLRSVPLRVKVAGGAVLLVVAGSFTLAATGHTGWAIFVPVSLAVFGWAWIRSRRAGPGTPRRRPARRARRHHRHGGTA
jgi:hypothetical protein